MYSLPEIVGAAVFDLLHVGTLEFSYAQLLACQNINRSLRHESLVFR